VIELTDERLNSTSESLLLGIGEVEIEIEQGLAWKNASDMFNDGGAEYGFAAPRYTVKPQEGVSL
jgi:hypothetical protein